MGRPDDHDQLKGMTTMAGKKRAKQTEIPGTERKSIKEIEDAAEAVRAARVEVKDATKARDAKVLTLIAEMRKHGVMTYRWEDDDEEEITIDLESKDQVRVRVKSKAPPAQQGSVN